MSAPEHPEQRAGIIAGAIAYTVWGLLTVYWKQLHGFNAFELIGWRITSSATIMAVALTLSHGWGRLSVLNRDRRLLARVAVAALMLTVNWTSYVWAVVHGQVLETALGYFIAPLGTVTIGVVVLHEPLRIAQRVALTLAASAVVVLTIANGRVPWIALAMAATWTVYGYTKKQLPLSPMESMAAESFMLVLPAATLAIVLASSSSSIPRTASAPEFAYAIFTGVATVAPLMLFAFAAQRVPLTVIGPMQYIVPSMNFLIGWLLYNESLPPLRVTGFVLVWIGLAILSIDSVRRSRRPRSSVAARSADTVAAIPNTIPN